MRRFQPSLLGGLFIGVLSALPIVGAANLCCCLWVVIGGFLTTYLERQQEPTVPLVASQSALLGLVAGVVGAVLYIMATIVVFGVGGEQFEAQFRAIVEGQQLPPEGRELMERLMTGRNLMLFLGAVSLPVYAVFSMLGSLLGVAVFRRKTPPAGTQA
jgi:hypothetical protein